MVLDKIETMPLEIISKIDITAINRKIDLMTLHTYFFLSPANSYRKKLRK